jgi:cytochrome P450
VHRLLRLGALAAAPWPLAYACSRPELARAYPRRTWTRALYVVAYVGAAVACAIFLPLLLVPFAVVAAAGLLTGLWLMRPSAGRARGLPPGSLSLVPVRQFVDERFVSRQIERFGAVSKTTWPTLPAPVVCIHGLRRSADVLREQSAHLAGVGIAFDPLIPAGFLRNMAADDHRRYKRIFEQALTDELVDAYQEHFETSAGEALRTLAAKGDRGVDPRPHLVRASVTALAPLLLGVEPESTQAARAVEVYDGLGEFIEPPGEPRERRHFEAAVRELDAILRQAAGQAVAALATGREPMPSMPAAIAAAEPLALDDPNVTLNLVFLLRTASVDVAGLLHWVMKMLGDNPEWAGRLRGDDRTGDLARRIVLETLRLHQSEFIQRRALQELELDGRRIPAGWFVRLCVRESHRDPAVFPDPDAFDPDRFAGRRFSRYEYSPFGRLEHRCIGATATLVLATCFVSELSCGYDWTVVQDGPAEFNRYHWRPSRRFRVRLEARPQV